MKKHLVVLATIVIFVFFPSCMQNPEEVISDASITISVDEFVYDGVETKTNVDPVHNYAITWAETDIIGIFPRDGFQEPFRIPANQVGKATATFDGGYWQIKDGLTYNAYYPFSKDNFSDWDALEHIGVSYVGQSQNGKECNAGAYDYTYSDWKTASFGKVSFSFHHLGSFVVLKLKLPATCTYTGLSLNSSESNIPLSGSYDLTSSSPAFVPDPSSLSNSISMELTDYAGTEGEDAVFYMMMPPVDLSSSTLTVVLSSADGDVSYSVDSKNILASKLYELTGKRIDGSADGTVDPWGSDEDAPIQFEDANFKAYCVQNFDTDGDGEISLDEAKTVTSMEFNTDNIRSIVGIKYFSNLKNLSATGSAARNAYRNDVLNSVSFFVTGNYNSLDQPEYGHTIATGQLHDVDLSGMANLRKVVISSNMLESIDLSGCSGVEYLDLSFGSLKSIDISRLSGLVQLRCDANQLSSLDVSSNTSLTSLSCSYNALSGLDVSENLALTSLNCSENYILDIDVRINTALTSLYCTSNLLTSLDVSKNTALRFLGCGFNRYSELDVSKNAELSSLDCRRLQLTNLDLSNNTALTELRCGLNQLSNLDLLKHTALQRLECYSNQLTSLDVSNNTALKELYCYSNKLSSLDVSNNAALTFLDCSPMSTLTKLIMKEGQSINRINVSRDDEYIPERTSIDYGGEDMYGYVDLGLSVKWATCNLGASNPEDYGGYYQWGGTEDVTNTNINLGWDNTPYHTGSSNSAGWTKYVPVTLPSYWSGSGSPDNKTVLDLEDDAAYVALGGEWHTPTDEEWQELTNRSNCSWEWTTINGIEGYRVTSKKQGYTDKSIFLPAAGYRTGTSVIMDNDGIKGNDGTFVGYYWASSLYSNSYPYFAASMHFNSGSVYWSGLYRSQGYSIRPVYGEVASVTSVSLNQASPSLTVGESKPLNVTISPSNAREKSVTWVSSDPSVATVDASGMVTAIKAGTATITVTTVDGSKTARCTVRVTSASQASSVEYVDLGLSVKWATCNLGASRPENSGGYYQWAGTEDVTNVKANWSNTPYHTESTQSSGWTKYIPSDKSSYWSGPGSPDNKTVLDLEDDAAHVALGGNWRMPTDAEWMELRNNCTWTWTTVNGVTGFRVTSNKSSYTDKSIFLPAVGYRSTGQTGVGSSCYYWSSSINVYYPDHACGLIYDSDRFSQHHGRFYGHSIRPVLE